MNDWLDSTLQRLESFKDMKANWDSYHALAPDHRTIDHVKAVLRGVIPMPFKLATPDKPHVYPDGDGGVMVEWQDTPGVEHSIDFYADGEAVYLATAISDAFEVVAEAEGRWDV